MIKTVIKVKAAQRKGLESIRSEGVVGFTKHTASYAYYRKFPEKRKKNVQDILFIDGNTLPHPTRYRVYNQIEQLRSNGLTAESIFYGRLNVDMLKYYRCFVFFRCPTTDTVQEFIELAKQYNKTCFFDIDDLVIDQKYTDQITYVQKLIGPDKELYNDGVNRMRKTLQLCDYAITSTTRLKQELEHYTKEVYVNRNTASVELVEHSLKALKRTVKDSSKIVIGYFSGSITHNENIDMILPDLVRLMQNYPNLYLKIVGILDLPPPLKKFDSRIIRVDFMDWRKMPSEVATCDINIAPLVDTIFNEAKSENKWVEAALVNVVTAASDMGAFQEVLEHNEIAVLVPKNGWYDALEDLIIHQEKREKIAHNAHLIALKSNSTIYTGNGLATFIRSKLARNIAFVLPSTDISGGVNVALKHADILRVHGWDVTLIDAIDKKTLRKSLKQYQYRLDLPGYNVITAATTKLEGYFDTMVATLWATVKDVKRYPNVKNRCYFVQNFETDFYNWNEGASRILANATYADSTQLRYITMSLWCKEWLEQGFNKIAKYAPNGIDLKNYPVVQRDFNKNKLQILIEGDSKSEYKNTDEAFKIIEKLDAQKFEISYLSYRKEPKDWYRVDHFYNRIAPEKVGEIYAKCDILIKTSLVESFSYPPLEMMATGGLSVVLPNGGNVEYLQDAKNCLFYKSGDIEDGAAKVMQLVTDKSLRDKIIRGGLETAEKYQWKEMVPAILALYL